MRRALIVAVETYPRSQGLDGSLPGTTATALAFRDWVITRKRVQPGDILFCAAADAAGRTHGTDRADILRAILTLVQTGKDSTDELYVFYSGHGFAYPISPSRKPVDVLVGADFEQLALSGGACLQLQEIQTKLWYAMGPGNHYYFVDACRTLVQPTDINVPDCGVIFGTSDLGRPTVYTMCSTTVGQPAWVASGFPKALIDGLAGAGRAKGWNGARLVVTFDLLGRYLLGKVGSQPIDSTQEGTGDGVLLEIDPVPAYACDIVVDDAQPGDGFVADVLDSRRRPLASQRFDGPSHTLTLAPDDYFISLTNGTAPLLLAEPPSLPVDLYEPRRLRFQKGAPPAIPAARLAVNGGGASTTVEITHVQTGQQIKAPAGMFAGDLMPGTYSVKVRQGGDTVAAQDVTLMPGLQRTLELSSMRSPSPVSAAIVQALPAAARAGDLTLLSDTLGEPLASSDPGLLLALAGASRIVADPDTFSKLRALPLARFDDLRSEQSAIYVLAERGGQAAPSQIKFGDDAWHPIAAAGSLSAIGEERRIVAPGAQIVSFHTAGYLTASILVRTYAGYVTLLVATSDASGRPRYQQFALPAWHIAPTLPLRQTAYLLKGPRTPLQVVWDSSVMQGQFARRQRMAPGDAEPAAATWRALRGQEWINPMMTALAAYDLVRAGLQSDERPDRRFDVLHLAILLHRYFESPDSEALANLAGGRRRPRSSPAMLDGVLAMLPELRLPLPADRLDYESPWTLFRGAVPPPESAGDTRP
jgi:hypothetical protein